MHVSKGSASRNSTKIWLTKQGGCFLANNNSKIPLKDLRRIMEFIEKNYEDILIEWKKSL